MDLQQLGFTQDELQERVINRICDLMLGHLLEEQTSPFYKKLEDEIAKRINDAVNDLAAQHVLPRVTEMIETLSLQETNRWGEKTGKSVTFIEYLVSRAEAYITEKLDFEGKSREEAHGYPWKSTQTRLAYMIHRHLHYAVEAAMKQTIGDANAILVNGLKATCEAKLKEIAASLNVKVATK